MANRRHAISAAASESVQKSSFSAAEYLSPERFRTELPLMFNCYRANVDKHMLVMVVLPVTSFSVPITVMLMMPIFIVPIVVVMIFVSQRSDRTANDRHGGRNGQN